MKKNKILLALIFQIVFGNFSFSQQKTIETLYTTIKEKNINKYQLLFSDSSYEISGRRLSIMRQKNTSNVNIKELKSNSINDRSYSVFNLSYIDKDFQNKKDTICLLVLLKKIADEWKIEEICENSDNKGELFITKKIDKYYSINNLDHNSLSDSVGVALTMEFEMDRQAFDEQYKIFQKNHWIQIVWKNMNINTSELIRKSTNTYFDSKLKKGFVEFIFSKENGEFTFNSCIFFKINSDNNIEYFITDGQKKEFNLFK